MYYSCRQHSLSTMKTSSTVLDSREDKNEEQNIVHDSENSVTGWTETDVQTVLVLLYVKSNTETQCSTNRDNSNMLW